MKNLARVSTQIEGVTTAAGLGYDRELIKIIETIATGLGQK